jgi:hypothetical protein
MRVSQGDTRFRVRAIAGTHVVLVAMDMDADTLKQSDHRNVSNAWSRDEKSCLGCGTGPIPQKLGTAQEGWGLASPSSAG